MLPRSASSAAPRAGSTHRELRVLRARGAGQPPIGKPLLSPSASSRCAPCSEVRGSDRSRSRHAPLRSLGWSARSLLPARSCVFLPHWVGWRDPVLPAAARQRAARHKPRRERAIAEQARHTVDFIGAGKEHEDVAHIVAQWRAQPRTEPLLRGGRSTRSRYRVSIGRASLRFRSGRIA